LNFTKSLEKSDQLTEVEIPSKFGSSLAKQCFHKSVSSLELKALASQPSAKRFVKEPTQN